MVSIIDQELWLGPGWAASTIVSTVSIINSYFWACAQFADFWVWAQPELSICCASQKDRSSGDQNDTTHLLRPFVVTHMVLGSRPRWVAEYPHPPGPKIVYQSLECTCLVPCPSGPSISDLTPVQHFNFWTAKLTSAPAQYPCFLIHWR